MNLFPIIERGFFFFGILPLHVKVLVNGFLLLPWNFSDLTEHLHL